MLELFRQVNWTAFILHTLLVVLVSFVLIMIGLKSDLSILIAAVSYMGLSVFLQRVVPRHHRMGFRFLLHKEYESASVAFQESWNFFSKNIWLDKYRSIFLLSASKMSYREMALINRSLCYWQSGNNERALESYKEVLGLFPDSRLAKEAIHYIENPEPKVKSEEASDSES